MKKIKLTLALVIAVAGLLFTACNPKSNGKVTIVLNPADTMLTAEPGDTLTWHYTLSPDAVEKSSVGTLTIKEIRGNGTENGLLTSVYNAENSVEDDFSYVVPSDAQDGEQIKIVFSVTDGVSGLETDYTVTIVVNATMYVEATDLTLTYVSTSLDNQMMLVMTRNGVSLEGGTSTDGQIAYVYNGDVDIKNTLASPNAQEIADAYAPNGINYTTSDKQITFFKKLSGVTWSDIDAQYINDNVTVDETTSDYIAGNSNLGYGVAVVGVGDLVAFNNPTTGVKGVVKVNNIQYAKSGAKITATINIDLKYLAYPANNAK